MAVCLALSAAVRADMSDLNVLAADNLSATEVCQVAPTYRIPRGLGGISREESLHTDLLGLWRSTDLPSPAIELSSQAVMELPPDHGSYYLVIYGLISLGAFQLPRSARKLHLVGCAPEWFGSHGPSKIGHTSIVELNFDALPICHSNVPVIERLISYSIQGIWSTYTDRRGRLPASPTRGPPLMGFS